MYHQNGNFNGTGTCSATSFGKFNFNSILSTEAKAISIMNCPDINAHLRKLRQNNIISEFVESGKQ